MSQVISWYAGKPTVNVGDEDIAKEFADRGEDIPEEFLSNNEKNLRRILKWLNKRGENGLEWGKSLRKPYDHDQRATVASFDDKEGFITGEFFFKDDELSFNSGGSESYSLTVERLDFYVQQNALYVFCPSEPNPYSFRALKSDNQFED